MFRAGSFNRLHRPHVNPTDPYTPSQPQLASTISPACPRALAVESRRCPSRLLLGKPTAVGHPLLSPVLAVCYYAAVLLRALLLRALLRTGPFTCEERPFKAHLRARNTTA